MKIGDEYWLRLAIELSRKSPASPNAFSVGCVITDSTGTREVSHGYSRESSPSIHAEESALAKLTLKLEANSTLYSSLEPCSVRKSGARSCCERIIEAGVRRVVYALREPNTFVNCDGHAVLERAGLEVTQAEASGPLPEMVRQINAHLGSS